MKKICPTVLIGKRLGVFLMMTFSATTRPFDSIKSRSLTNRTCSVFHSPGFAFCSTATSLLSAACTNCAPVAPSSTTSGIERRYSIPLPLVRQSTYRSTFSKVSPLPTEALPLHLPSTTSCIKPSDCHLPNRPLISSMAYPASASSVLALKMSLALLSHVLMVSPPCRVLFLAIMVFTTVAA